MASPSLRFVALKIVQSVLLGRSLSDALADQLPQLTDARDRAFVQALCYGVCRLYARLDVLLSFLLEKPLRERDTDIYALLLIGLYQLLEMRVSTHAAVSETVNTAKQLKKPWSVALVNGVLRNFLRQKEVLLTKLMQDPEAMHAHPEWWIEKINHDWGTLAENILQENNKHPPLTLRVNQNKISRDDYLQELIKHGISAKPLLETASGIILDSADVQITALPGFDQGFFSVQDGAAQLCAPLLQLEPGQRVLDAAAAPGGKLTHILEWQPNLETVVAVEKDKERLALVKANLKRLNLCAICIAGDALESKKWWDGKPFDRILLDAPCTASGVLRRHPDIKLLRRLSDIKTMASTQLQLLQRLWPLLTPGGLLLYATCSIFPEENEEVISKFLSSQKDARVEAIDASWGKAMSFGRQILPGMHDMDGFYYATLRKD